MPKKHRDILCLILILFDLDVETVHSLSEASNEDVDAGFENSVAGENLLVKISKTAFLATKVFYWS